MPMIVTNGAYNVASNVVGQVPGLRVFNAELLLSFPQDSGIADQASAPHLGSKVADDVISGPPFFRFMSSIP